MQRFSLYNLINIFAEKPPRLENFFHWDSAGDYVYENETEKKTLGAQFCPCQEEKWKSEKEEKWLPLISSKIPIRGASLHFVTFSLLKR